MLPSLNTFSRLRLEQLRLLIAPGKHGSLARAAEQVPNSQPGANKTLQEIEASMGAMLLAAQTGHARHSQTG